VAGSADQVDARARVCGGWGWECGETL